MSERKSRLRRELANPEYREVYAENHVNSLLAAQISTIRSQRGFNQEALARLTGMKQSNISRVENVTYAKWNIKTLREIAAALGCWLDIRIESWGILLEDASSYTADSLRRDLIDNDPVFLGSEATDTVPEPVRWMQCKVLPWLVSNSRTAELRRWLLGRDLPPVGDNLPPYVWVARAVDVEPKNSPFRRKLIERLFTFWDELDSDVNAPDRGTFYLGLFNLLAIFPTPDAWPRLKAIYLRRADGLSELPPESHAAFVSAVIRNQFDRTLEQDWYKTIEFRMHQWLPADEFDGFEGIKRMTETPRLDAVAQALNLMYREGDYEVVLNNAFELIEGLRMDFGDQIFLADVLLYWGKAKKWQQPLIDAWSQVFGRNPEERKAIEAEASKETRGAVIDAFRSFPQRKPIAVNTHLVHDAELAGAR